MLTNHVSCQYVVNAITVYHSALVDLSRSRTVHAVEHDPCCPDPTKLSATECKAVHYGICSPLLKLPPFSIPPETPSAPSSPATPKSSSQSCSKPSTPTAPSVVTPPLAAPKVDLEILDPVELLAADLEGKLEALVNTFVAQDKVRLAARKSSTSDLAAVSPLMPSAAQTIASPPGKTALTTVIQTTSPTAKGSRKDDKILSEDITAVSPCKAGPQVLADPDKQIGVQTTKLKNISKDSQQIVTSDEGQETIKAASSGKNLIKVKKGDRKHAKGMLKLDITKRETENQREGNKTSVTVCHDPQLSTLPSVGKMGLANAQREHLPSDVALLNTTGEALSQDQASPALGKVQNPVKCRAETNSSVTTKPLTSILSALKPSPEYQQTGVKAQITKFTSIEKEGLQSSPTTTLERKLSPKSKLRPQESPMILEPSSAQQHTPLSLETLQELLKAPPSSDIASDPIPTTIFRSSKIASVPFENDIPPCTHTQVSDQPKASYIFPMEPDDFLLQNQSPKSHDGRPSSYPGASYKDLDFNAMNQKSSQSQAHLADDYTQDYDGVHMGTPYRLKSKQESVQSAVDYAKTRFQNVQQGHKVDEVKPRPKNGHLVSEAKFKWENLPSLASVHGHQHLWNRPMSDSISSELGNSMHDSLREVLLRSGHKRCLSMEGLTDPSTPSIPHPKLTMAQRQHIRERCLSPTERHSFVPIRPFLTKGSVAERVLLFECCPDRALERASSGIKTKPVLINTWRAGGCDVHNKTQDQIFEIFHGPDVQTNWTYDHCTHAAKTFWEVVADVDKSLLRLNHQRNKENIEPGPRSSSLKRATKSTRTAQIPRFYFPDGKPMTPFDAESHLQKVAVAFSDLKENKASREDFGIITKACGLPLYWKLPLLLAARGDKKSSVSCEMFLEYWRRTVETCHDDASKFVRILSRGSRNFLLPEDFIPMMQDVIDTHQGLTFLKEATEFHSRYIHTVIARIYYCVNRSWSGKITAPELRKSNFLRVLSTLEDEEDINQITEYFSYEHFYVIYCKFWELDKDHDLYIDQNDLKHHNGGALSTKIIERIFSGAVTRGPIQKEGKMSYTEFVWFLISEEDKRHPRSIEYWFRCMDFDGDGFLSMYELEHFYREQLQRLDSLGIETLPFNDCLCQMLDIIKPKIPGKISLSDLKKCKMTPIFFDTFFNLEKYMDHEQRDPFSSQRQEHEGDGSDVSDWDRYAAEEYELLVAEEGAADQQDELIFEECHPEDDELSSNLDKLATSKVMNCSQNLPDAEDEYDYADSDADYHY